MEIKPSHTSPQNMQPHVEIPLDETPDTFALQSLHDELYHRYDKEIVDDVFKQISRYNLTNLPEAELNRIKLFCHYYDMERKLEKFVETTEPPIKRIFRRYIRHTRTEITNQVSHTYTGDPLTISHIDQVKLNMTALTSYLPLLLQQYDEWTCHRALDHYSIVPSDILTGKLSLPDYDLFCQDIDQVFAKEKEIQALMEAMPYEAIIKHFDVLLNEVKTLKDPHALEDLQRELHIKAGRVQNFIPLIDKCAIKACSTLYNASLAGTRWAEGEKELTPLDKSLQNNINDVFFLKSRDSIKENESVAVFKAETSRKGASGAMEALAYDTALIFGLSEGLVPTKQKVLKGMLGSIQVFQEGLSFDQFSAKPIEEQRTIIDKLPLKNFLQAGLASTLLGNRDVHRNNFFFVERENGEYGMVVFDNEYSFQYSNYVYTAYEEVQTDLNESVIETSSKKKKPELTRASYLPLRCALLMFPQADQPITGETKKWLQDLTSTWPQKFDHFYNYLHSPLGIQKLNCLPYKNLDYYQLKAFKERLDKLMHYIHSDGDYSFRDLLARIFPLFPAFYGLTRLVFPENTEFWVGAKSAEYLCEKAIKYELITEEKADEFLSEVYHHADK